MIWPILAFQILGETTTRRVPLGGAFGPPALPAIFPKDSPRAWLSTVHGVLTQSLPIIALTPASNSSCVTPATTTVTPEGCPPTAMAVMASGSDVGGMGRLDVICHPAASIANAICWANSKLSASSRKYMISVGALGCPFKAFISTSRFRLLGATWRRNSSSLSSASFARVLNSAIRRSAFFIRSSAALILWSASFWVASVISHPTHAETNADPILSDPNISADHVATLNTLS